jgi:aminoglycoside 2'-N-acetyltransferase I
MGADGFSCTWRRHNVVIAHTAQLREAELAAIRRLLDDAFGGQFDDHDWDHTLGGVHTLIAQDDHVIAHAAVVRRQFVHDGRAVRVGYVEGVAVDRHRRGCGYAAAVLNEAERVIRAAYDLGALSAAGGVEGLYLSRGWLAWQGPTSVLAPGGITRTPDDDGTVFVLPVPSGVPVDVAGTLVCDWRAGDVW